MFSTNKVIKKAKRDIGSVTERDLWFIGIALYWAEGSKSKEASPSVGVDFCNSDPNMIKLYIKWLIDIVQVTKDRISLSLYVHQTARKRISSIKRNWSLVTGLPKDSITYIYYKKHKPKTLRKNLGDNYWGVLRVRVKRSTGLNRKIMGWIEGISK